MEIYNYCTCEENKKRSKKSEEGRTPIREVEVNSDGVCLNCGHYAVSTKEKVKTRTELYNLLRLD